jgi:hypothetical protein
LQPDISKVIDRQQIQDLLLRYCRGIDRMDQALVRSCYHQDAMDEHGSFIGSVDEFIVWCWRLLSRYTMTMHYISNILVEIDGDRAQSECYGTAVHRGDQQYPERNLVVGFRFVDVLEKRSGQWRILRRVATTEWVSRQSGDNQWPIPESMRQGQRDVSDIIYQPWRE